MSKKFEKKRGNFNCYNNFKRKNSEFLNSSKVKIAKNCIENSKNCNNFHTGSKLGRKIPLTLKTEVSKSQNP